MYIIVSLVIFSFDLEDFVHIGIQNTDCFVADIMPAVDELTALVARLEAAVSKLEAGSGGAASSESLSASVSAYDELVSTFYKPFSDLSKKIGGDVATMGAMLDKAFAAQREFLATSSKSKQPGDKQLQLLLKPTSDCISEVQSFREKSRRSEYFNHLSAISESIPALGWVAVAPAPAPFVKEMNDAGQFYTNRFFMLHFMRCDSILMV